MKQITKAQKIGLGAILMMMLVVAGYVFFFKHIIALQDELLSVKTKLATVKQLEENKLETLALLNKTDEGRREMSTYFVSVQDPTPFLELIETLGDEVGAVLEVENLSVEDKGEGETQGFYENVKIVFTVEGDWNSLYQLLLRIEHMPYLVTVSNATFSIDKNSNASGLWKGKIELLCSAL